MSAAFPASGGVILLVLLTACGGSPAEPSEPDGDQGPAVAPGVYYVAMNEAGADNNRCDGLSPVDTGNGHCPLRDFQSARTVRLLNGVAGVRVVVRAGVYSFSGGGLIVSGTGTTETERTVVSSYPGETVTFDGGGLPRELVRVSGRYVTVQGLTLTGAAAYNLEIRGARNILIEGNRFLANVSSDALKGDGGAADVQIRGNEFTQWDSQAIDMTGVSRWRIDGNQFHDSAGTANAIGAKSGTRDVTISNNTFRNTRGLTLGGVGAPHPSQFEAYDIVAERNTFENISGFAVTFYSCSGCRFDGNQVRNASGGLRMAGARTLGASGCAGGCAPSRAISVEGNRLTGLIGGVEGGADVFWAVDKEEAGGLSASQNLYCRSLPGTAQFWWSGQLLAFSEWVQVVATDANSTVAPAGDARCSGW